MTKKEKDKIRDLVRAANAICLWHEDNFFDNDGGSPSNVKWLEKTINNVEDLLDE